MRSGIHSTPTPRANPTNCLGMPKPNHRLDINVVANPLHYYKVQLWW